jgi:hypothetical protein
MIPLKPAALSVFIALCLAVFSPSDLWAANEPETDGGPPSVRRLTPSQYQAIITDVFGPDIKIGGRFQPDSREEGLLAVGTSRVSITVSGLTQYEAMARSVARQVVDEGHRATLDICRPQRTDEADDVCARQFLARAGTLLFRRPLTESELNVYMSAAANAATTLKDFYAGLGHGLAGLLASPDFLFRKEVAEPDPAHKGQYRLDGYSKASRLSFFLWNTAPDLALLAAAESGEIHTKDGLKVQVDRILNSHRIEAGIRAFFTDMLEFDRFATFSKDSMIFPNFTSGVATDAREQTLSTIVDHLVTRQGDYRDLFTTRHTFLTPILGSVYNLPVPKITANGAPNQWLPYLYADDDPRGIGILSHASFLALHSHPGRSSPTRRGKAVRELLLCQHVPDPPGIVEFTVVQDTASQVYRTARERLQAHANEPMCAGCHKITDPIGLALETFDSAAGFRTTENGAPIDTSGVHNGKAYADTLGLSKALHDDPAAITCIVNKTFAYGLGRPANKFEKPWIEYLTQGFEADGHRFPDLMRRIAGSDAFYRVGSPETQDARIKGKIATTTAVAGGE